MDKIIVGRYGIYNSLNNIFQDEKQIKEYADNIINCLNQLPRQKVVLINLSRLLETASDNIIKILFSSSKFLYIVLNLFAISDWLSQLILSQPETILWLKEKWEKGFIINREDLTEELARYSYIHGSKDFVDVLISFRKREYLRISVLDFIMSNEFNECVSQISLLADVIIESIYVKKWSSAVREYGIPQYYDECGAVCQAEMSVIGLGKLGSNELNYSSDIDLIFLYSHDGETSGGDLGVISNKEFFTKLARSIIDLLNKETESGSLYRVDMDLRPDGKSGDLVISLPQALYYYQTWAQIWEKLSLLRARYIAGSKTLCQLFLNKINNILTELSGNEYIFQKIYELKLKIEYELKNKGTLKSNIKLGKGGIRDIELIIQILFLYYFKDFYFYEHANTLKLIHLLTSKRYLTTAEQSLLHSAYIHLRKCEHLLQIMTGRQIHTIPENKEIQSQFFEILSYIFFSTNSNAGSVLQFLTELQNGVRSHFEKIFNQYKQSKLDQHIEIEELIFVSPINVSKLLKALQYLKVQTPEYFLADFKNIVNKIIDLPEIYFSNISLRRLLIDMFVEITKQNNSKNGLKNFDLFLFASKEKPFVLSWLLENRGVINTLTRIFCYNEVASTIVWNSPELLTETLFNLNLIYKNNKKIDFTSDEKLMESMRVIKKLTFLIIAFIEETGSVNRIQIQNLLSDFARFMINLTMEHLSNNIFPNNQIYPLLTFSLGRLSLNEFDYTSDLDLIWIETPSVSSNEDNRKLCFKLIQNFIKTFTMITSHGSLFKIDHRIKPSGYEGQLSVSMNYFIDYLNNVAQAWELLALHKLSFVSGEKNSATEFQSHLSKIIKEKLSNINLSEQIQQIMKKFRNNYHKDHIKYGEACLFELNLLLQYLLIKNDIIYQIEKGTMGLLYQLNEAGCFLKNEYEIILDLWNILENISHAARKANQEALLNKPIGEIIRSLNLTEQFSIEHINSLRESATNIINKYI